MLEARCCRATRGIAHGRTATTGGVDLRAPVSHASALSGNFGQKAGRRREEHRKPRRRGTARRWRAGTRGRPGGATDDHARRSISPATRATSRRRREDVGSARHAPTRPPRAKATRDRRSDPAPRFGASRCPRRSSGSPSRRPDPVSVSKASDECLDRLPNVDRGGDYVGRMGGEKLDILRAPSESSHCTKVGSPSSASTRNARRKGADEASVAHLRHAMGYEQPTLFRMADDAGLQHFAMLCVVNSTAVELTRTELHPRSERARRELHRNWRGRREGGTRSTVTAIRPTGIPLLWRVKTVKRRYRERHQRRRAGRSA